MPPFEQLPCSNIGMKPSALALFLLLGSGVLLAQTIPKNPPPAADDCSGTYSFLKDGEFVQISVEDNGSVSGFVSRYGDADNDRDAFLDHAFKQGKLAGRKLTFTTETVHNVWYEFTGTVERGEGKQPGDEAYYVLKGKLLESRIGADKKTSSKSRDVVFKSFPQNLDSAPPDGSH
jgi:hypothetical protein